MNKITLQSNNLFNELELVDDSNSSNPPTIDSSKIGVTSGTPTHQDNRVDESNADLILSPSPINIIEATTIPKTDSLSNHSDNLQTKIADLFIEVVLDRPLDVAYTYGVPSEWEDQIEVGKRVEITFGRGDKTAVGFCINITTEKPTRTVKNILRVLDDESLLTNTLLTLTRWIADYYLCAWGQVLQAVLPAGVRDRSGLKTSIFVEPVPSTDLPNPLPKLSPKQQKAFDFLRQENRPIEQSQLGKLCQCGSAPVLALWEKGYIRRYKDKVERLKIPDIKQDPATSIPQMNEDQLSAWQPIKTALTQGGYAPFLLHGVTGSGKTEIYLRAIEEVIQQGKEAIVLVPEISLTPQTIERFQGRCGSVAVLHSHLTNSERGSYWRRVASGKVQIVVGARSAIFAPCRNLGLIVIDEEHETSFKQESTPRYHARDVAVKRAQIEGIPLILGSATPALESWEKAKLGEYQLLSLKNRVENRPLPEVQLIDLRHEKKAKGQFYAIGPTLEQSLHQVLQKKGQAILLLNRRGFSTHLHCPICGHVISCLNCDLALTYHRQRNSLLCHYCNHEEPPNKKCPVCQQHSVQYLGLGTEKLQAEIEAKFPNRIVFRMDSDTTGRNGSHQQILDAFRRHEIDILVGTQMIAKGLDFPNVHLVGVVNADVGLHLPDFRATERTFQLLAQVAGRTGRGNTPGKVLIQTYVPEHPCIQMVRDHDYLRFAETELVHRKTHNYPPYQQLIRIIIRSLNEDAARNFTTQIGNILRDRLSRPVYQRGDGTVIRILGPAEAIIFRLNKYFRFHFQLQSNNADLTHQLIKESMLLSKPPNGVEYQIDVDPFNLS